MACSVGDVRYALVTKLGFEESDGRKHTKYKLVHQGQIIAFTVISHGDTEIGDPLISRMAREICIQTRRFKRIIECLEGLKEYLQAYNPDLNPRRPR